MTSPSELRPTLCTRLLSVSLALPGLGSNLCTQPALCVQPLTPEVTQQVTLGYWASSMHPSFAPVPTQCPSLLGTSVSGVAGSMQNEEQGIAQGPPSCQQKGPASVLTTPEQASLTPSQSEQTSSHYSMDCNCSSCAGKQLPSLGPELPFLHPTGSMAWTQTELE